MGSFYRQLILLQGPVIRDWDLEHGHRYDSALAGCSSLRAAVLRARKIENGIAHNKATAQLLWDMEKFYDSVDLVALSVELIRLDFPPELLILGILAHAAPRILKVGKGISEPMVNTCKSILAGCQCSVS